MELKYQEGALGEGQYGVNEDAGAEAALLRSAASLPGAPLSLGADKNRS